MAIVAPNDQRTLAELQRWDPADPGNAPFVKIGRLLLAVDQTGAEAWQPLIKELKRVYGARDFVLYSGRHGALEGCFQDNGMMPGNARDLAFLQDDQTEASRFAPLEGVNIEVLDSSWMQKLIYKRRVLTDLAGGSWVIVAWCHSIASMCTIPNGVMPNYERGSVLWVSAQNMVRRRVSDIVREDYAWVPMN
jgi:hypothetical protein